MCVCVCERERERRELERERKRASVCTRIWLFTSTRGMYMFITWGGANFFLHTIDLIAKGVMASITLEHLSALPNDDWYFATCTLGPYNPSNTYRRSFPPMFTYLFSASHLLLAIDFNSAVLLRVDKHPQGSLFPAMSTSNARCCASSNSNGF